MSSTRNKKSFFILSCARSGSTSLAHILDMAANGVCVIEPAPNLNVETRDMMDGRIDDPLSVVKQTISPRVFEGLRKTEIYGEKNVTYGPFIPYLYKELDCRFVFIKRDGRDVVRSLIDWHNRMFGTVYRECVDPGDLTPLALSNAANLPVHLDTSDYSRPRPMPNEQIFEKWEKLSRFEMCTYYWEKINDMYLDNLEAIPKKSWITIDYTSPELQDILRVVEFLGLKGISEKAIADALERRINSLSQRGVTEGSEFPQWPKWSDEYSRKFNVIAGSTMTRLGYNVKAQNSFQTAKTVALDPVHNFGEFWKTHDGGHEWYKWMYNYRILQHQTFQKWFQFIHRMELIESIADFGCGMGVGYVDFFENFRFVGFDLAPQVIDWCKKNYRNPKHEFRILEFIKNPPEKEFDLVYSQGTIDNAYDMNAFLRSAVKASRKWIYITAYRGFFPELETHRYEFNPEQGVYYNDISPLEAYSTLNKQGCGNISIFPSRTAYEDITHETVIIAHI